MYKIFINSIDGENKDTVLLLLNWIGPNGETYDPRYIDPRSKNDESITMTSNPDIINILLRYYMKNKYKINHLLTYDLIKKEYKKILASRIFLKKYSSKLSKNNDRHIPRFIGYKIEEFLFGSKKSRRSRKLRKIKKPKKSKKLRIKRFSYN